MFRAVAAFIFAPFPAAFTQTIIVGLWPKVGKGVFEHPSSMFIAIALYFYVFGLLLGVPAGLIIRRRSASLKTFSFIGFAVAVVPISPSLAIMIFRGQASTYVVLYNLMLFGLGGLAAGALFWRLAIRKKDKARVGTINA